MDYVRNTIDRIGVEKKYAERIGLAGWARPSTYKNIQEANVSVITR
ncbi:MAG: hypothetical protein ACP5H8_03895 [Candidatus Micrarchaeia archaeon]